MAKTAGRERILQPIFQPLRLQRFGIDVFLTFILVMSFFRNGLGRASRDALSAFFVSEQKTVLFVVTILFLAGSQLQKRDNAADS